MGVHVGSHDTCVRCVYRSVEVSHQFRSVVISHYVQVALEVYNPPVGAVLQVL
jgi:hypothetical protein